MTASTTPPSDTGNTSSVSLRAVLPLAVTMVAVLGAMFAQQALIDAAKRWREG